MSTYLPLLHTHLSVFAFGWNVHVVFKPVIFSTGPLPCVASLHKVAENQAVHTTGIHADTENVLHHGPSSGVNGWVLALVHLCYRVHNKVSKLWVQIGWHKHKKPGDM